MSFRTIALVLALAGLGSYASHADEPAPDAAGLFRRACAMCHGPDGRADVPMGRKAGVKDLTVSTLGEDTIRGIIQSGARNPKGAMPAFGTKFSNPELDALVAYVRSLRTAENAAKR